MKFLKVERWCDEADAALGSTLTTERDEIIADVNSGRLDLWRINDGESWLITCVRNSELAVCCVAGRNLVELSTVLHGIAQREGLTDGIYFFTKRPALKRLLRHLPIELMGYVFKCKVDPISHA